MASSADERYLLLMRHPPRRWEWEEESTLADVGLDARATGFDDMLKSLSAVAGRQVRQVVARTVDTLLGDQPVRVGRFLYAADSPVARAACSLLSTHLKLDERLARKNPTCDWTPAAAEEFASTRVSATHPTDAVNDLNAARRALCDALGKLPADTNAIVLVAHSPLVDLIASRRRPEKTAATARSVITLDRAEVACLVGRIDDRSKAGPRFVVDGQPWVISPSDQAAKDALLTKLQTKMTVAGIAGGVTVAVLAVVVQGLATRPARTPATVTGFSAASAAVLFAAAWLYLTSVFWLDRLMMPARFWTQAVPRKSGDRRTWLPRRPPSADVRIIYSNMIRTWTWFVQTATALLGVGLILLTPGLVQARTGVDYWWCAVPVGLAIVLGLFAWWKRPILGVSD